MKKHPAPWLTALAALLIAAMLPMGAFAAAAGSTAGQVSTQTSPLTVRSQASATSTKLTTLPKGSTVTLMVQSGSWWYVEYAAGRYGYCHADYITQLSGSKSASVVTASSALNVRSGAGSGFSVIAKLPKGTNVVVLSQSGGWSRVLYDGVSVGYVSSSYLSVGSAVQTTVQSYKAVSLSVPDYKQYDSRWSSLTVGSSGQSIGQIGCTVTALAMTESYRTGTTITPATMRSRLTYTSGGAVYWPENYTADSAYDGYLERLYARLSNGTPVIVGAKTSAGKAHWVVVTGYSGGSTLTPAGFSVNDPGSSWRKTLADLFSNYPNFYKMEYDS